MWKIFVRPGMIIVPLALGALLPQASSGIFMIKYLLIGVLYFTFLKINVKRIKIRPSHYMLLAVNILMGVVPYFLLSAFGFPHLAMTAFFVGITPTATAAPAVIGFLGGRVEYALTAFVITTVGVTLALIGLLPLVCGNFSWSFIGMVVEVLLLIMVVPVVLAAVSRLFVKRDAPFLKITPHIAFTFWSLSLFLIAADASAFLRGNPDFSWKEIALIALISLVICAANFTIGRMLEVKRLRREASQSLGQKNTTLTIYLALAFANPLVAMGPIFYVLWHNSYNAFQMFVYDRHKAIKKGRKNPPLEQVN